MLKRILAALLLVALLAVFAVGYVQQQAKNYGQLVLPLDSQIIIVEAGSSAAKVLNELTPTTSSYQRLLRSWYFKQHPELTEIKKGHYRISDAPTVEHLLTQLVNGEVLQFKTTFIEGTRVRDWFAALKQAEGLTNLEILDDESAIKKLLDIDSDNLEGWLFPDTYIYQHETDVTTLLQQSHQRLKQALDEAWQQKDAELPLNSAYEMLILASIVEKESAVVDERPRIASVFVNRLRIGMRLQTDPTVIYGLGDEYQGNITRKHLRTPTPYNTYTIDRLPPTPISSVSLGALQAVAKPETSDYLYFVASEGGRHYFSKTLAEHNRAVRKYQLKK